MIRDLQVINAQPVHNAVAAADVKRGMPVKETGYGSGGIRIEPDTGLGPYLADLGRGDDEYGEEAPWSDSEVIAANSPCLVKLPQPGNRYAVSEVTGTLGDGDYLVADGGTFKKASSGEQSVWVYGGAYDDPTGIAMHVIQRVVLTEVV